MTRRSTPVIVLALSLAMAFAACGDDGGSAQEPRSITVYSGRSESLVGELIPKFEAATGIDVKIKYGETSELAALIAEEGSRSPADVFWAQDAGALGSLQGKNLFASLPGSILDKVAAAYRSKEGRWVGVSGRVRVIAYNPELVKDADVPDSVEGLTAARWKNKVGWAPTNGSFQIFVTAFRTTKGEAAAKTWLTKMKASGTKTFANNDAIAEAVGEGEIPLGLVNHYYPFEIREEHPDAKIENHFLTAGDVGGLVNVAGAAVLETSDGKTAAQRFIDFLLGSEAQTYFVQKTWEYPLVAGVAPDARLPKLDSLQAPAVDLTQLADLEGTLTLLRDVGLI